MTRPRARSCEWINALTDRLPMLLDKRLNREWPTEPDGKGARGAAAGSGSVSGAANAGSRRDPEAAFCARASPTPPI